MIASNLSKQFDYNTYLIGKWHLGETEDALPTSRGFDESLSFLIGGMKYMNYEDPRIVNAVIDNSPLDDFLRWNLPFVISHNNKPKFQPPEYMTDYLSDEASNLIRTLSATPDANPFFLTLAYNAPHNPLQALLSDFNDPEIATIPSHNQRVYAAMIMALDRGVGKVLQTLKETDQWENTIVLFTSDNGGASYIDIPHLNYPYRGWKATFFEGGLRVPLFMQWPAKIAPAVEVTEPVGHVDVFPTLYAAVAAAAKNTPRKAVLAQAQQEPEEEKVGRTRKIAFDQRFMYFLEKVMTTMQATTQFLAVLIGTTRSSFLPIWRKMVPPSASLLGEEIPSTTPNVFLRLQGKSIHNSSLPQVVTSIEAVKKATRELDGVSLLPFLSGKGKKPSEAAHTAAERDLFWRSGEYKAIIIGGWYVSCTLFIP
jgi:hypothetical protein